MQKEKVNTSLFQYCKSFVYELIQKVIESQNKFIGTFHFLFRINNSSVVVLRKITPYVFSGCSIIFIGYILVNIFTNYPPREIGISP
jgi:hypothetical protein